LPASGRLGNVSAVPVASSPRLSATRPRPTR
jgi:hypothetical protein